MPLAATTDTIIDFESWLALNTGYCKRHRCRLSVADCDKQKENSQGNSGDLRCQGCEGLNHQPEIIDHIGEYSNPEPRQLNLARPIIEERPLLLIAEKEDLQTETARTIRAEVEQESAFDLDCLNALSSCGNSFDLTAITALTGDNGELAKELYALFMGEDDEVETKEEIAALFKERKGAVKSKRYAVYQGRCTRC